MWDLDPDSPEMSDDFEHPAYTLPCEICGETEGVRYDADPYELAVNDHEYYRWFCAGCYDDLLAAAT